MERGFALAEAAGVGIGAHDFGHWRGIARIPARISAVAKRTRRKLQ
jgi:hypothetical protein